MPTAETDTPKPERDHAVDSRPTCRFITFGCKINQYDTQAIRESILQLGYREVTGEAPSDLAVVNACTVTDRAGEKGVQAVRRLVERGDTGKILVTGCLSPEDRDACRELGIEFVVGNEEKDQIPALVEGADLRPVGPRVSDRRRSRAIFGLQTSQFARRTRAFIKVHDGCDDFCSYCIIPFVRGKSKSRSIEEVVAEAHRLAERGFRELVITGIHLRRYGADLGLEGGVIMLMRALRAVEGIDRVRLSSIGVKAFTDSFLEFVASDPAYCRFFHIPLQSGSDPVLERMRREYSVEAYLEAIERIRLALPRAVVTTDLMVGFPGETEAEFETSLETCERAHFAFLHIFPYSVRTGTKAAALPDRVSGAVKAERIRRARELERRLRVEEAIRWRGETVQVLVERVRDGWADGLSREGHRIHFEVGDGTEAGSLRHREIAVVVAGEAGGARHRDTGPVRLEGRRAR